MKPGDLVKKCRGDADLNETGIVVAIKTNPVGYTFVYVLVNGSESEVKPWLVEHVEITQEGNA